MKAAVGYIRTSSLTNVGDNKDSAMRQRLAIMSFAANAGYEILDGNIFAEEGVKGDTPLVMRPVFHNMLRHCEETCTKTIIFEDSTRFCRGLVVQEVGFKELSSAGYVLLSATNPNQFLSTDPEAVLIRQMLGAVSEYQKNSTVKKLSGARERAALSKGSVSTITKKVKTCGTNSKLDGEQGAIIREALRPYLDQDTLSNKDARDIATKLKAASVTSKHGNPIAKNVLKTWFSAIQAEPM